MASSLVFDIGDLLGYADANGVDALSFEQIQNLEEYISDANEAHNTGEDLIQDALWDRLMDILRQAKPDSELLKSSWEDVSGEAMDDILAHHPMYSIQTVKSYECQEIMNFIRRLPDSAFDVHVSAKLNGHGIRLQYANGVFFNARSRARSSAGRDITEPLRVVLDDMGLTEVDAFKDFELCEVRGEWVLPFENMADARAYNPDIKSAFSGVASMGRDSASEDEWRLLRFVAYEFVADGFSFSSKEEEYAFLSDDACFEVPINWVIPELRAEDFVESVKSIVSDCENEMADYPYYTDGLVLTLNDSNLFRSLGDDGSHYKYGNIALKVGFWEQNILCGYVQTILWTKGKSKLSPVAIVAEEAGIADVGSPYIFSQKEIGNWKALGVVTQSGNKVRRIPLYEPANLVALGAYPGSTLHFRYGGEAGVVPCFDDGVPLLDGRLREMLTEEVEFFDEDYTE